ncbi:type II secretion system F family protein [Vibrio coralliilyticus]|uniref:type II secretion system F family protein n=1 Tax=Vibrio coralliilyticus TaxID=190893 RepID=UPI000BAAF835|nr:type II secretion system F family protein [Vibrio coralliilyticus]NOI57839.1 pilus assembly protein TadB [Vibrio coralliilyticus]PAT69782.1 pilus assembly protein TadB [Vibrio coralliilyticus]
MILALVVIWCLTVAFSLHYYSQRRNVKRRLSKYIPDVGTSHLSSIVKSRQSGGRVREFLYRTDALLPRQDKLLLALSAFALPLGTIFWLQALAWYWQTAVVSVCFGVLFCTLFVVRRKKQIEEFDTNIVQVLGLVSRAVSAGLSVPQAIEQVANSQTGLLGREFALITDNLALGISLRQTLDEACTRLPYRTFRYFSVALILNQSNGGQLREILHNLSRTMHDNRAMLKKVKSMTAEPRMTAKFLSLLPLMLVAVVAWIDVSLFELLVYTESGQSILVYCAASIAFGGFTLHSLTKNRKFS